MSEVRVSINHAAIASLLGKVASAVKEEGSSLMNKSEALVPIDTGSLKASKFVEEPVLQGDKISVRCGYGGPNVKSNPQTGEATTDYAIDVHEDLTKRHDTGQAKFLEAPVNALRGTFSDSVKRRLGM